MIASMWIGNLMLVIINLPLIGIWVRLLRVPYRLLFPCILVLCCVGAYSISSSTTVVALMAGFAFLGYIFSKLGCESAPFSSAWICAWPVDGGKFSPLPSVVIRRPHDLRAAANLTDNSHCLARTGTAYYIAPISFNT